MQNVQKQNYAALLKVTLAQIEKQNAASQKRSSLLLHACCAPCSSYVLEYLNRFFDITIYYYNPNIHPEAEYTRRLNELKNFLPKFAAHLANDKGFDAGFQQPKLIEATYIPQEFFDATQVERDNLQHEAERGERCRRCYKLRMERSYNFAVQNRFDFFTTTLSISPHKDAEMINAIGFELENAAANSAIITASTAASVQQPQGVEGALCKKYLCADFKKQNGFKRSLELSKEFGLYRQDYCGCVYSQTNNRK